MCAKHRANEYQDYYVQPPYASNTLCRKKIFSKHCKDSEKKSLEINTNLCLHLDINSQSKLCRQPSLVNICLQCLSNKQYQTTKKSTYTVSCSSHLGFEELLDFAVFLISPSAVNSVQKVVPNQFFFRFSLALETNKIHCFIYNSALLLKNRKCTAYTLYEIFCMAVFLLTFSTSAEQKEVNAKMVAFIFKSYFVRQLKASVTYSFLHTLEGLVVETA